MANQPHFIRDYRRVAADYMAKYSLDDAMALAVGGGGYDDNGKIECQALVDIGLRQGHFVVDIGCGSGRLSTQLSQNYGAGIGYLGIDVVPEFLAYARAKADDSYRFEIAEDLTIPAAAATADFVAAFSVFTHLKHRETKAYLREARRILRPGGRLIFSFLELPRPSPDRL
jgi:ubiquinone/menaquinone biosynthesis C-methylase UbiE